MLGNALPQNALALRFINVKDNQVRNPPTNDGHVRVRPFPPPRSNRAGIRWLFLKVRPRGQKWNLLARLSADARGFKANCRADSMKNLFHKGGEQAQHDVR